MNQIKQIEEAIKHRKEEIAGLFTPDSNEFYAGQDEGFDLILSFIRTLRKKYPVEFEQLAKEYRAKLCSKMTSLSEDNCPFSHEEYLAYKEGWRAALMLAEDIFIKQFSQLSDKI